MTEALASNCWPIEESVGQTLSRPSFSLVHPSRGRPQIARRAIEEWLSTAAHPLEIEHILVVDESDPTLIDYRRTKADATRLLVSDAEDLVSATNIGAKAASGDILVYLSDDFACPRHWDALLMAEVVARGLDPLYSAFLIRVDDGIQQKTARIVTIPIMSRVLLTQLGYLWHPDYRVIFVDNDLFEVCDQLGVVITSNLLFQHRHDLVYKKSALNKSNDARLFKSRKALGFPSYRTLDTLPPKGALGTDLVIYHHLGLGDHFICNGLVHVIAAQFASIHLPCKRHNLNTVKCLYADFDHIRVFPVDEEYSDVHSYCQRHRFDLLKVGFNNCDPRRWDVSFYDQLGISFASRYQYFRMPKEIPGEDELYKTLAIAEKYCLVHREISTQTYDLAIDTSLPLIEIKNGNDSHDNLLSYRRLIQQAEEIHCVNSSVVNLVNSIRSSAGLYYHAVRPRGPCLRDGWRVVSYKR